MQAFMQLPAKLTDGYRQLVYVGEPLAHGTQGPAGQQAATHVSVTIE